MTPLFRSILLFVLFTILSVSLNAQPPVHHPPRDFDGDGKSDIATRRGMGGFPDEWWILNSRDSTWSYNRFGVQFFDYPKAADFTGDGKADVAVFRFYTGEWFILRSENDSYCSFLFGAPAIDGALDTDSGVPADYDGDGKADPAVFRLAEGVWFILRSSDQQVVISKFGSGGDRPLASDFDGDGKADLGIIRANAGNGEWWIQRSTAGLFATVFGQYGDICVPGDYTGDGKSDIAVFRPSTAQWFILKSEDLSTVNVYSWGAVGDLPVPGDYDGDGKFDLAVFRDGSQTWLINRTGGEGPLITHFGSVGHEPLASWDTKVIDPGPGF